jgi:hypothetical protein
MTQCEMSAFGTRCAGQVAEQLFLQCSVVPAHVSRERCCRQCAFKLRGLLRIEDCMCVRCQRTGQRMPDGRPAQMRELQTVDKLGTDPLTRPIPRTGPVQLPWGVTKPIGGASSG